MALTLHIGNKRYSSWSMRPWVLLKALDIPFEEKLHLFKPNVPHQTQFRTFSPTGKVPTLYHDDLTICDSLAIMEYIAEDYPAAWPRDRKARAFARSAVAEMHSSFPAVREQLTMNVALRIDIGTPDPALQREIDRVEELWNEGLSTFGGPWLAGAEFTAADAFWSPVAVRFDGYGIKLRGPAADYAKRLLEHPAVVQWVKDGRREKERLEKYETEIPLAGGRKLLADLSE
ncbi:glutathione S-transferase domain-containing protein [Sodiomyces alkalinus F11]|uniref:Glutathione S-transferase domain-containing protein n=1 Tax=Sodiomyces alkalinus (strain CBS 110278 / VKM F-3762 / F11) TaxID=1314773 RepID=A0A3N2PSI9_SODAK|nr:glutathione S-transferase domain-containing protein [Sodiomyces alkalinus F11]ROT37483.1 glutathione S-transferase domain-containing protein [Sodiomyces alkalinus F11]